MANLRQIDPVLLIIAAFSRHAQALEWGRSRLEQTYGPIGLASIPFEFTQTKYYESSMGTGLRKIFWAFRDLVSPEVLSSVKLQANALEMDLAQSGEYPEARPLNLDPGLLSLGKFMLATTKDQGQRIYIGNGIFAEVTLRYQGGSFVPWEWTYADYRQPCVHEFLLQAREYYRQQLRG
jgi:Domain of unknown function (DUF4416)